MSRIYTIIDANVLDICINLKYDVPVRYVIDFYQYINERSTQPWLKPKDLF